MLLYYSSTFSIDVYGYQACIYFLDFFWMPCCLYCLFSVNVFMTSATFGLAANVLCQVIALTYAIMTTRSLDLDWKMRALRVLPMFALPIISILIYTALTNLTRMRKYPLLKHWIKIPNCFIAIGLWCLQFIYFWNWLFPVSSFLSFL